MDQDTYIYDHIIDWQQREPDLAERREGVRPSKGEVAAWLSLFNGVWTEAESSVWPTAADVERAGMRSNCVGLSHYAYRMVRDYFNIADNDLWLVIYRHRSGELHTVLSLTLAEGHFYYDPSFVAGSLWSQHEREVLWKYNLFDIG